MDVEHSLWQGLPLVLYLAAVAGTLWHIYVFGWRHSKHNAGPVGERPASGGGGSR